MRAVEQLDVSYSNKGYVSVFIGTYQSQELFDAYTEQDYDRLHCDDIGCELGIDFGINFYDEDFAVLLYYPNSSTQISLFSKEAIFDIRELEKIYPHGFDAPYNVVCQLGGLKYEGPVKEVDSKDFGHFKFLGYFKADWAK